MCKSDMWAEIQRMARLDPIIAKSMDAYNDGTLEDQTHILMAIVLDQAAALDKIQITNQRLQSDFYARKANA